MKNVKNYLLLLSVFFVFACHKATYPAVEKFVPNYKLDRFENEIKTLEKEDNTQEQIVFYGSSSFRIWKNMKEDLAPLPVLNHGFGGSTFPELTYYVDRMVIAYQPKVLVIYCENDMFSGKEKSWQQNFDDYRELIEKVRLKLPEMKIYTLSLKPSPSRKKQWSDVEKVNKAIEKYSNSHKQMAYIDITKPMFLPNGQIDGSIFTKDSLHMNLDGYKRWVKVIKPILMK